MKKSFVLASPETCIPTYRVMRSRKLARIALLVTGVGSAALLGLYILSSTTFHPKQAKRRRIAVAVDESIQAFDLCAFTDDDLVLVIPKDVASEISPIDNRDPAHNTTVLVCDSRVGAIYMLKHLAADITLLGQSYEEHHAALRPFTDVVLK